MGRVSKQVRRKISESVREWHRRRREELLSKGGSVPVPAEPESHKGAESLTKQPSEGEAREGTSDDPSRRSDPKAKDDSCGGPFLVHVVKVPVNPRMVLAEDKGGVGYEIIVGDNKKVWLGCPLFVRQSVEYKGYWEVDGALPRGRWDRAYLERFEK